MSILALALIAPGAGAQEPAAQSQQKLGEDPFSVMMKWRPTKDAPDMPDFVKQTRPSDDRLGYTPVTGEHPARPARKSPEELAATLGKLDSAAAASRARAANAFKAAKPAARRPATKVEPDNTGAEDQ